MQFVVKRDGTRQELSFDAISKRIVRLAHGNAQLKQNDVGTLIGAVLPPHVAITVTQKVISGVVSGVHTRDIDLQSAQIAAEITNHPAFGELAGRIYVSNLHKETNDSFSETFLLMYEHNLVNLESVLFVRKYAQELDNAIMHARDYTYTAFAMCTLTNTYLKKIDGRVVERPQYALMREAIQLYMPNVEEVIEVYKALAMGHLGHATPTKYNACTNRPQLASCFLLTMADDSIAGIYKTLAQCAEISKYAGGIGLSIHNIRAKDAYIAGTDGHSNGIVPMLKVFEATAKYVDQGGGKRKGSFAIYLEPWHADIEAFINMVHVVGLPQNIAPDLFYGLWMPDLFMKRVLAKEQWSLFCPHSAPGLSDVHGDEFERLYHLYEAQGLAAKTMPATELLSLILSMQIARSKLYWLNKDRCNLLSNQKNLGTIHSSNLCCEIIQYSSPDEVAVCNLAAINIPACIKNGAIDYDAIQRYTAVAVRNLNQAIDRTYYPIPETKSSNLRHRPIGIGVLGLCDAFMMLNVPYESDEAIEINKLVYENMYYAACKESALLAAEFGPYETYEGSPMSQGKFQFDLWREYQTEAYPATQPTLDWEPVRELVRLHGMRNSLLLARMPCATTSQLINCVCEGDEPLFSNVMKRSTLAGTHTIINPHLFKKLVELGLCTRDIIMSIMAHNGSVQHIEALPEHVRKVFKTVWEIPLRAQLQMAADRGPFIDQSSSQNVYLADATTNAMWKYILTAWRMGLKTLSYYTSTRPAAEAIKFTLVEDDQLKPTGILRSASAQDEGCDACGV